LKKAYGLPVITIKSLIEDIKQDRSEFAKEIKILLDEIKTQKVE